MRSSKIGLQQIWEKMLPIQIVRILNVFDGCGFNSGSSNLSKNPKSIQLICYAHITIVVILTLFKFYLIVQYYPSLRLTEAISEIVQYSTALNTCWCIVLDNILHQNEHQGFWTVLQQIDTQFCSQSRCNFRNYLIKFIEFFSMKIIIIVVTMIVSFISLVINTAYFVLFTMCAIRMIYYLFCLEVVHFQLKMIENELKTMQIEHIDSFDEKNSIHKTTRFCRFESQRFHWIRGYFHCVYRMVDFLNKSFGWSQVAGIIFCFSFVLTEFHWIYIHFNDLRLAHRIGKCRTPQILQITINLIFLNFTATSLVLAHWQLLIVYLFHSAANCSVKVM